MGLGLLAGVGSGRWVDVVCARPTPKAASQYDALYAGDEGLTLGNVMYIAHQVGVWLSKAGNPFYVLDYGDLRFVFVVQNGSEPGDGYFRCVQVLERWGGR